MSPDEHRTVRPRGVAKVPGSPQRGETPAQDRMPRQRPYGPPPRRDAPARRTHSKAPLRAGIAIAVVLVLAALARVVPGSPFAPDDRANPAQAAAPHTDATVSTEAVTPTPTPTPTPPPLPALRFRATDITLKTQGFFAWALMDRRTGEIWGSDTMTGTTWPASMIKAWLAADYLRRNPKPGTARLQELEIMIRDSDNSAAQDIYVRNGQTASIKRLISLCKLTDTKANSKGWSFTYISARDTVRMADCIEGGQAAGPQWTNWLLGMMRKVRGEGDFGIRKALPTAEAATVSIKNGWLYYDDDHNWHINCMAVTDTWAMAVLQRYPGHGKYASDYAYGRNICKQVATQLLNPDYVPSG